MVFRKNPSSFGELHELAQKRLPEHFKSDAPTPSLAETRQLFAELEIHQIELELQNEQLDLARTQLELALSQSRELYDFAPIGIFSIDPDGAITKLNLAGAALLGEERARLIGARLAQQVTEAEQSRLDDCLVRAKDTGEPQSGEFSITNKALSVRKVDVRISPLPEGSGWQLFLLDITERKYLESRLQTEEARWKLALEAAGHAIWDWNLLTGTATTSRSLELFFGYAENELKALSWLEAWVTRVHPEDRPRATAKMRDHLEGRTVSYSNEHRSKCKDGSWKWVLSRGSVIERTPEGKPSRIVGTVIDISDQKRAEETVRASAQFQQAVFDSLSALVAILDHTGSVVQTNAAWRNYARHIGLVEVDSKTGDNYLALLNHLTGEDKQTVRAASAGIGLVVAGGASFALDHPFFEPVGRRWFSMKVTPVGDGNRRIVVSHEDVTPIKAAELASLALANVDTLTGALSRHNFLGLAELEVARSRRYELQLMVLMLDLDHFKQINDQFGHASGDAVLHSFVQTVKDVLRESDLLGRLGGEEFAVLLPNTDQDGGHALAQRIVERVRASPAAVAGDSIAYTVSIGGACLSGGMSFTDLLKLSDTALYRAKKAGRNRLEVGTG